MPSLEFNRFYKSCFGTLFAPPGEKLDIEALQSLRNEEREQAERLILDVIETTEDYEPVEAVGYLNTYAAIEPLKKRLMTNIDIEKPWNRIAAALALFRIERSYTAAILIDILHNADPVKYSWSRETAAMKLSQFGKIRQVIQALLHTLYDKDKTLARTAKVSLWLIFKPNQDIEEILQKIDDEFDKKGSPSNALIKKLVELINSELTYTEGTYSEKIEIDEILM